MKFRGNRGDYYLYTRRITWFCYLFLSNRVVSPIFIFQIDLKRNTYAALRKTN